MTTTTHTTFTKVFSDPKITSRYKASAEKFTGHYASVLLHQAGLPPPINSKEPLVVLDNACGSGIVSSLLYDILDEDSKSRLQLVCGDLSELFVKGVEKRIGEEGWKGAEARVVDMQKTNLPTNHFTHVLTNFAIGLVPDPKAALAETFRILQPAGISGLTTWSTIGWYPYLLSAFSTLPANTPPLPSATDFMRSSNGGDWHMASYVTQQLSQHGFVDVEVESLPNRSSFTSAAEFCDMLEPMVGVMLNRFWTEEERVRCGEGVVPAVKRFLEEKYGPEGVLEMDWVGIVATGRKPSL